MSPDKVLTHSEFIRDKKRAYARRYYQVNKGKARAYYQKNQELIKIRADVWRLKNRERYLKQQADYDAKRRIVNKSITISPEDMARARHILSARFR